MGVVIRVLVEGSTDVPVLSVIGAVRDVRTEHDVGHRVGLPLQSHLGIPLVRTRVALAVAVVERRGGAAEECLAGIPREGIAIVMVPAHAAVNLQFVAVVVEVQTGHLRSIQTLTATAETATAASARESHVVGIVGISHEECLKIILHHAAEDTS